MKKMSMLEGDELGFVEVLWQLPDLKAKKKQMAASKQV